MMSKEPFVDYIQVKNKSFADIIYLKVQAINWMDVSCVASQNNKKIHGLFHQKDITQKKQNIQEMWILLSKE